MSDPLPPEFWQAVARSSPDPLVVVDRQGSILLASDQVRALLGWEPGELSGKPVEILVPEASREEHVRHHRSLGDGLPSRPMGSGRNLAALGKDGRIVEVEIGLSSVRLPQGPGFMAVLRPLSHQRRLERACHSVFTETARAAGPAFFEALVSSLARSTGTDCAVISVFPPGAKDRLRTKAFWRGGRLVPQFEYPLAGTPCEQVVSGRESLFPEGVRKAFPEDRILEELGVEAYLGVPLRGTSGEVLGNIILLHDRPIPEGNELLIILRLFAMRASAELERSASEEALTAEVEARRSMERCQRALVEVAFLLAEPSGRKVEFQEVMGAVCRILGWAQGAVWEVDAPAGLLRCRECYVGDPGEFASDFSTATRTMTFAKGIGLPGRVWAGGEPAWIADCQVDPNFPRAPMAKASNLRAAFATPIVYGGEIRGVLEFFREEGGEPSPGLLESMRVLGIHLGQYLEREHSRVMREKAQADLQQAQKMEAVGQLAGGIAHDFNNILTAVLGYCDLLAPGFSDGDPRGGDVREIKEAARRAVRLTSQLLAFSRRQVAKPVILDVREVVGAMGGMLRRLIREEIELAIDPGPSRACALMDRGQLEQVVVNLVVNAGDAVRAGGRIELRAGQALVDEKSCGRLRGLRPGLHCVISVRDTGTGMTPEVAGRIFEPFFTTKAPGKGTGLGLSTVYGIAQQSGGAIEVESAPGQGSVFRLYLPIVVGAVSAEQERRGGAYGGKESILVVEDEEMVRKVVSRELSSLGYKVVSRGKGGEALDLLAKDPQAVDLLLTDIVMPEMNGLDLYRTARRLRPGIKVLFMSGYAEPFLQGQLADQMQAILEKPFSTQSLGEAVRRALDSPVPVS